MVSVAARKSLKNLPASGTKTNAVSPVLARPFLKWAGGKSQLLEKFQSLYPPELREGKIRTYYEPFLGSGAVFFHVAQQYAIKQACLYDINEELILAYSVVQSDVNSLLEILSRYQKKYKKLDKEKRHQFFYAQRSDYNSKRFTTNYKKYSEQWVQRAAQLIFLNRTCYNGLYRVNSKGEFNSPVGDYVNPTICDEPNLLAVNKVLAIAEIKKADFTQVKKDLKSKSFVYFDPPYRPISKTANFKAYSKHEFADSEQQKLANLFTELDNQGARLMLSNSDPKNINPRDNFFDELYAAYEITRVPARRMINSDSTKRGRINEIVVTNYPVL
jgi:DNA adenine methylase